MRQAGLFIAALLLAAAGPVPARAADLGKDLAGESCQLTGADITCGTAKAGTARLIPSALALPPSEPARRQAVAATVRQVLGGGADPLRCDTGKALDADTYIFLCGQGTANWPHVALASAGQGSLALVEGLPSMAPVLTAALAIEAGHSISAAAAAIDAVKAAYPARVLETGAGDYARSARFVAEARATSAQGNYAASENAWRDALDVQTRLFGPDSLVVGGTLLELALQVSNQQRFDEAAALMRRATPIIEAAPNPAIRARLASYRGLDAANQRSYADAYKYARDAVIARQADVDAARAGGVDLNGNAPVVPAALQGELARALWMQAEMAMRLDDLPGAQAAGERALYIVSETPSLPLAWRADMVSLMGDINDRQGRVVVAEKDFTQALAMNRKLFGDGAPTVFSQLRLARFYADQQVYPAAIAAYREGFEGLAKNPLAKAQVMPDLIVPFLAAASAQAQSVPGERARLESEMFAASQIGNTGVAGMTIARVAARRAADNPALSKAVNDADDAGRARDEVRMGLAAERAKPDGERDPVREKALSAQLAAASEKSDALTAKLRTDFPAYAQMADPGAVSLADLQKLLRPRETFVSYVIGQRGGFVLAVSRETLTARPVAATVTSLAADIADLRSAFVPRLGKLPPFNIAASAALYRQLLAPIATALATTDHLAVATSGDLANLPFALLVTGEGSRDYARADWLIRKLAISQVPSARAFASLRATPAAAAPRPFLGVANPGFDGAASGISARALNALASTCQQGAVADPDLLRSLPPLPDTANEVQTIARLLKAQPDDVLMGQGATETALRAKPLNEYAVLYFATHGLLPGELHCQAQPGLVLSPPASVAATPATDGLLTASEIAGLRLNARLVVLSACNTAAGGGSRFGGGALEGLADSFFDAGAHGVVASHWEVPSVETTQLMTGLFANLAQGGGHDSAEALRQAQLSLIARDATAHPFDWAAFTLIGDGS